jgi:hypothetical protein
MHTQHALALARQQQEDLRRAATTPGGARLARSRAWVNAARLMPRRQRLGWLLVDVGLQLAVDRDEHDRRDGDASEVAA